jgi:hypothetical protein
MPNDSITQNRRLLHREQAANKPHNLQSDALEPLLVDAAFRPNNSDNGQARPSGTYHFLREFEVDCQSNIPTCVPGHFARHRRIVGLVLALQNGL